MHCCYGKPLFVIILTLTSLSASSVPPRSESHRSLAAKLETLTENQALIFENIYGTIPARRDPKGTNWQSVRSQIKDKASMDLNQHVRVGVDSVKTKSLDQKSEIIALDSHLAPRNGGGKAKGYGVTFKIKFD